jgi:hypothetical protein
MTLTDEPRAGDQLDDGAEEQERAVEGETGRLPVRAQEPIKHLEPLVNITSQGLILSSPLIITVIMINYNYWGAKKGSLKELPN